MRSGGRCDDGYDVSDLHCLLETRVSVFEGAVYMAVWEAMLRGDLIGLETRLSDVKDGAHFSHTPSTPSLIWR